MFNPYFILASLVALLTTAFGADHFGYHRAKAECAAAVATAQDKAIADANAATEAATKRAVEQAKVEAAQRLAATTIRLKGERDAAIKARPECARDPDSMQLLQQSIAAANGQTPAGDSMSDPVRADP